MLKIQTSTLDAPPDATPKFTYQLCSDCAPIFVIRAVPGYIPGACNGCILDAVFDLPSSTLDFYSSISTSSTLSSAPDLPVSSIGASSTGIPGLTSSQNSSRTFTPTVFTEPSDAADTRTTSAAGGDGLVTVVTGTATLTQTITSTIYLPASPGGDDQFGRVVTTCYPVTTCSEFTATLTIPAELCTTYTTTNDINNQVETCTEPVPWWTPSLPKQTQLPAAGSQDTVQKIPDAPSPVSATNSVAESDGNGLHQLGVDNQLSASPEPQANDVPIPQDNVTPPSDGPEDDAPTSTSSGFKFPAQPPERPTGDQEGEMIDSQEERPSSVPSALSAGDAGDGNTTFDASDGRFGIDIPSTIAQSIGCWARTTAAKEALIVIIGLTLLLVCL